MWTRVSITYDKGQTQASLTAGKRAQNWSQELRASRLKGRGWLLFCTEGDDPVRSHAASTTAPRREETLGGHSLAGGRFHPPSVKRPRAIGGAVL